MPHHFSTISPLRFSLLFAFIICCLCTGCSSVKKQNTLVWYEQLPTCPCENPDKNGVKLNDGWAQDKGNIDKYHHGATASFRSYPFIRTSAGKSGQQCCYDADGKLITAGSGAGTPDKVSTCSGEDKSGAMKVRWSGVAGHIRKDVNPWKKLGGTNGGWVKYNLLWQPDIRNGCAENKVIK